MKTCDFCGATPATGTFPNLILCYECRASFFDRPPLSMTEKREITKQPVLDRDGQMARIDAARPSWHKQVYGGCK